MSTIFGALRIADSDRVFNSTAGQRAIYDVAAAYVAEQNAALDGMLATFVESTTPDYKLRYKLPGGGYLQRRGGQAQSGAVKATGQWDVAFPLYEYGDQIAGDRVSLAYMTAQDMQRHLDTVITRNVNTVRFELLYALWNNTARTFTDEQWGSLSVQPLANSDSVVYPPVIGSVTEAAENHYLATNYAASAISDTNDPINDIVIPELEEHFGQVTGNSPIVVFCHGDQVEKLSSLAALIPVQDRYVRPGQDTDTVSMLPGVPGRVIGRHARGAWIVQWDWTPTGYLFGMHLDAPRPLIRRVDAPDTGLPTGLAMISEDAETPFKAMHWSHRFGFGVGNRLNGVAVHVAAAANYTIPTAYA